MDIFRRISGSSTSSTDESTFKRSRSLSGLRRKSSKDSSKGVKIKSTLKETIKDYNASQQAYTSAPQSPLFRSRKNSGPESLHVIDEDLLSVRNVPTRPASERMYSHGNDSICASDYGDSPVVTALSPRRDSTIGPTLTFNLPRLTSSRRISEHIDPMSDPLPSLSAIPKFMAIRKQSEAFKIYDENYYYPEIGNAVVETVQKTQVEKIERIVPQVSVLPDLPEINSASSSLSERRPGNRASIISIVTSNSSAPSPTAPMGLGVSSKKMAIPYIPDDESVSFDLLPPGHSPISEHTKLSSARIEELSKKLMSKEHLRVILSDQKHLSEFSKFIEGHRPQASMALLNYYLDATKAIKAISYANSLAASLGPSPLPDRSWIQMEDDGISPVNKGLERKAHDAFKALTEQELPLYVAWVYSEIVTENIHNKITGSEVKYMDETANELAEVFCVTDPKKADNPIIFASEEFHKATQYPISYVSGRNCRFLQGPKTSRHSTSRIKTAVNQGEELTECFLNYKRDGTPFINLCMLAPLCDAKGQVRYYIGAQVDVTALVKGYAGLESFKKLMSRQRKYSEAVDAVNVDLDFVRPRNQEFKQLCELFSSEEMDKVRRNGGQLHKDYEGNRKLSASTDGQSEDQDSGDGEYEPPMESLMPPVDYNEDLDASVSKKPKAAAKKSVNFWTRSLTGVYRNYILVRPYPSLRIVFASPSMRTPGILQSSLMSRVGGDDEVRDDLHQALTDGRGLTVKVRWLSKLDEQNPKYAGRERWLHCTPLFGSNGAVGVWMIVIVDDDTSCEFVSTPEYEQSDPLHLGVEARPGSGSSKSYRLSADVSLFNGIGTRRKEAPAIQDVDEWRSEHGMLHPDLAPFDGCEPGDLVCKY